MTRMTNLNSALSVLALRAGMGSLGLMTRFLSGFLVLMPLCLAANAEPVPLPPPAPANRGEARQAADVTKLENALERLKLPGVKINIKERCVDVESSVALDEGALEFIACTRDTKEHESIIVVEAKPSHIHTALLLLGAKPGHPAMRKALDEEGLRFVDLPPRGGAVDVFIVVKGPDGKERERPISDFIEASEDLEGTGFPEAETPAKFPTHTFLFAGSILYGEGDGPRTYIADNSGSVISLSTFGDELLCLPGVHGHANGALMWQVNGDELPGSGSKVVLRLRPKLPARPAPKAGE